MDLKEIKALGDARKRKASATADVERAISEASLVTVKEEEKIEKIKNFLADPTAMELDIEDEEKPEKIEIEVVRKPTAEEITTYIAQLPPREMSDAEITAAVKEKPAMVDDETLALLITRRKDVLENILKTLEPSHEQVNKLLETESGRKKLEEMMNTDGGQKWLLENLE